MLFPKRPATVEAACRPVFVEPVKDTRPSRLSYSICSPTCCPVPWHRVKTELKPFFFRTSVKILVVAKLTSDVSSCPFQIIVFPQMSPIAVLAPGTDMGKLKAEMIPIEPIGFHYSKIMCSGRSLGIILPPIVRDMPTAMSQISMYS